MNDSIGFPPPPIPFTNTDVYLRIIQYTQFDILVTKVDKCMAHEIYIRKQRDSLRALIKGLEVSESQSS